MTDQTPVDTEGGTRAHRTIAAALAAAQSEMGRAKKSANNPHFKSKYADLDSVCDAAMPALNRHGIAVVQPMQREGDEWVVVTRFVHGESGEVLETPVPIILGKRDMQGLGSAMTYARRYGLMALAGIAPEDDDGNAAAQNVRETPPPRQQQRAAPPADPGAMRDRIKTAIGTAQTAEALDRLWKHPKTTEAFDHLHEAMKAELTKAYTDRMAEVFQAPADDQNADLDGDHIPNFGEDQ